MLAWAEVPDLRVGGQAAGALEEAGELQAGAPQRDSAQCGGGAGAQGGGERTSESFTHSTAHPRETNYNARLSMEMSVLIE